MLRVVRPQVSSRTFWAPKWYKNNKYLDKKRGERDEITKSFQGDQRDNPMLKDIPDDIKSIVKAETKSDRKAAEKEFKGSLSEKLFYKQLPKEAFDAEGNLTRPTYKARRPMRKLFKREEEPPELTVAPTPQMTHLSNYSAMCDYIEKDLGGIHRWKYPQEWEDYMEYAIENGVGLTPEKPHLIYSESGKAIASCVCDPEMPYVNYHYVEENDGEPMCCACGYYFKLERMLVAPQAHQMMSIPDEGWFDPRLYNPDNHTYQRPANKQPTPAKDVLKEAGINVPLDSGMRVLELARAQKMAHDELESREDVPQFSIDYRQKPKGISNYQFMEMRQVGEGEDTSYETLLLPEDPEEAHKFLHGTSRQEKLEAEEQKKIS